MTNNTADIPRILRRRDVERLTGLSRSSIYQLAADGLFPPPVKLGKRASGWDAAAVTEWIEAKINGREWGLS